LSDPVLHYFNVDGIGIYSDGRAPTPAKPLVVMFHGAFRDSTALRRWPGLFADAADVLLFDLPSHGRSAPIDDPTVARMAAALAPAVGAMIPHRPAVLLIGESVGALVALALQRLIRGRVPVGLMLIDPPMSTAKLWSVQIGLRERWANPGEIRHLHEVARAVFGFAPDELREILYFDLFDDLQVPTTVVTGDVPLFPPRAIDRPTQAFDEVDQYVVRRMTAGRVALRQVAGCGHVVLFSGEAACRDIALEMLAALVTSPGADR
jgi:pimeloyl-ACP methyl ester carboxylesterase